MTNPKIMILPDKYPCSISSILISSESMIATFNHKDILQFNHNHLDNHQCLLNHIFDEIHWTPKNLLDATQQFLQHLNIPEDIYTVYILVS
uniref:Matrix protein 2-2 n=2 Tax=Human respiratory syncytial virus TaxID=11250 RepID=A0A0B5H8B6_HRSV|nr:matrix protein 2-2 [Human orthopneumovirus]QJC62636.1 transcription elongation factor M2-2 [Human orthopneumovirus]BBF88631.1 transcription-replication factor M2-2 [Human respiratory syncytial virus B]